MQMQAPTYYEHYEILVPEVDEGTNQRQSGKVGWALAWLLGAPDGDGRRRPGSLRPQDGVLR